MVDHNAIFTSPYTSNILHTGYLLSKCIKAVYNMLYSQFNQATRKLLEYYTLIHAMPITTRHKPPSHTQQLVAILVQAVHFDTK